ncbi:MAG: SPASM domain-containing protein [Clostridia bacterium]|nr:SPASM domain-containing protein [Clostridia bacterium]
MRCAYCFYHDETERREVACRGIMSSATADALITKAFEYSKDGVLFAFQGGEPTLAGLDFFERFVKRVKEVNVNNAPVVYTLQTNGLTMNGDWAAFLHNNHFLVGLSCDGDKMVHNALRTDNGGKGTFDRVSKAAECMKKFRVEFNILTVVTKSVAKNIKKVYSSFKRHGYDYLQFIPCIAPFDNDEYSEFVPDNDEYYTFLTGLFESWYEELSNGKYRSIRYFDNLYNIYKGFGAEQCGMQGHCSLQFVIEGDGDVYPCDFYCLDEYRLGNINEMSFPQLAASPNAVRFLGEPNVCAEKCASCEYSLYCLNGCRRYREGNGYRYCEASRRFYPKFTEKLPAIDRIIRNGYAVL